MLRLCVLHSKGRSSMMNLLDMILTVEVVAENRLEAGGKNYQGGIQHYQQQH